MIPCHECRQCNRKGKPSAMRGSKYCNDHRITMKHASKKEGFGLFTSIKNSIFEKRWDNDKRSMKSTKGFRSSWFWR